MRNCTAAMFLDDERTRIVFDLDAITEQAPDYLQTLLRPQEVCLELGVEFQDLPKEDD